MRRGFAFLLSLSALGLLAPAAFGQYPYPYGQMPQQYGPMPQQYAPMPQQYAQPYGYPMPMPAYGPNPMMARPMVYQPAPMMQQAGPANNNTKVFVYGPLDEGVNVPANPVPVPPRYLPTPPKAASTPASVSQVQAPAPGLPTTLSRGGYQTLPTYSKTDLMPEPSGMGYYDGPACGPSCGPTCGPSGCPPAYEPRMPGRGHFIGEVAATFLVPVFGNRTAFNTTAANGTTTSTNFAQQLYVGPRASLGYVFHTGWGLRVDYWHYDGAAGTTTANGDPAVTIATPTAPLGITSPSAASTTLAQGIGIDQFTFRQRLDLHVADAEIVKEANCFDSAFLFSVGARYARITQSYAATRTNPGGTNGVNTVGFDREDLNVANRFEGWGPTVSFDVVHPLTSWGLSTYGNARGSFMWGTDRFSQNYRNQNNSVVGGVPVFTDTSTANAAFDNRFVSIVEAEVGLQYGCRIGGCYVFARTGAAFQRWWVVGSPTGSRGNLNFFGGTARVGVTY